MWPTPAGNHRSATLTYDEGNPQDPRNPIYHPYKFVNITNIEISNPYYSFFRGSNVVRLQIVGDPTVPGYELGVIPFGLHHDQFTSDTVAVNFAHLCELPPNAVKRIPDDPHQPPPDSDQDGFEDHVGNPDSVTGECTTLWIRADSLEFTDTTFPKDDITGNFRHPFLHNAMTVDSNGQPYSSPLKVWTTNLVDALYNSYHNPPVDEDHRISDPNLWRFYNDSEGTISTGDSKSNAYFVFQQFVARRNHTYHADHSGEVIAGWWNHEIVPGFNLTLEQLYQQERAAQASAGLAWPSDIGDFGANHGFDYREGKDPEIDINYQYYQWWQNICSQVRLHAFKVSIYDVIHAKFPGAKYGNYQDTTADGYDPALEQPPVHNTSWFEDVSQINAPFGPNHTDLDWRETPLVLPHWLAAQSSMIVRATPQQWIAYRSMSRTGSKLLSNFVTLDNRGANVDSPLMYPLDPVALSGSNSGTNEWYTGWRQRNVYVNPSATFPATTDARSLAASMEYSNLVNNRMAVEAAINSYPSTTLPLGHNERVVPWVPMHVRAGTEMPNTYRQDEGLYRGQLMMLRAKKVKELLWFNLGARPDNTIPWDVTRELVFRVFTPEIDHVRRFVGKQPVANPPIGTTAPVSAQLEDTLRRFGPTHPTQGDEYTANINGVVIANPAGSGCPAAPSRTGLLVQFNKMDLTGTASESSTNPFNETLTDIEVRLEAQGLSGGDFTSVRGRLMVFNWASLYDPEDHYPAWYSVATFEHEDPYVLRTADGRTHLTFQFHSYGVLQDAVHSFISNGLTGTPGRMLVWLEQEGSASSPLDTKYDLLQAVTFQAPDYNSGRLNPYDPLGDVLTPAPSCAGPSVYISKVIVSGAATLDPTKSTHTAFPCDTCLATGNPTFLNSEFCQLPPNCAPGDPCYTPDKNVHIVFSGAVRAAEGIDLPVFIRKLDGDPSFNYASLMNIQIQHLVGLSDEITISGNGTTLLVPGTYEVTPIKDNDGSVVSPLTDAYSPQNAGPVQDFSYVFTLLSDCNLNGRLDYSDDGSIVTDINMDPSLDWWPYDHMIDACHPELCEPDFNGDGNIDQGDVDTLMAIIGGDWSNAAPHADPDFNRDGNADQGDVDALINNVAGNGCPN
ncbi:MAG: hypothetical protein WC718_12330 [Phycisphaerales bacterium]|jgi:hypothetical protein